MEFEDIHDIEDLETVSTKSVWQNFERLAAFIFEKNDFQIRVNTVKTFQKKRRQYDMIAKKDDQTFLVECEKWAGNRYRLLALKKAIIQHKKRTVFYESVTNEDAIPLIVALIEEEIHVFVGVSIVPVSKFNAFIHELEHEAHGNYFCDCEDESLSDDMSQDFDEYSGHND